MNMEEFEKQCNNLGIYFLDEKGNYKDILTIIKELADLWEEICKKGGDANNEDYD